MTSLPSALINRELFGMSVRPAIQRRIPIDSVIPKSALQAGHIVMGFSGCGRFVFTYTIRQCQSNGSSPFLIDASETFTYKLHFWLFVPHKIAKKVASVLLFDRNGVSDSSLLIHMAQWNHNGHNNDTFILVEGRSGNCEENPRCFLTLARLPQLNKHCSKCTYNSNSNQEQDPPMISTPCELHSLTITLNYELVPPYPQFDPDSSLILTEANTPTILINTGNMLHLIQIPQTPPKRSPPSHPTLQISLNSFEDEQLLSKYSRLFKPPRNKTEIENRSVVEKKFFKRKQESPLKPNTSLDIYSTFEITPEEILIDKNYKTFRKRRLADKKYEFHEETFTFRPLITSTKKSRKKLLVKKCMSRINRSFVLSNEEAVSTTTEIEDNEDYEYPVALPLCLYTDNSQLSMIRNSRLVDHKIVVKQLTLDIEILSNEVANEICKEVDLNFNFLIDYDCNVMETLPCGSIVSLVVLQIICTRGNCSDPSTVERLKYETNYNVKWSPFTCQPICHVYFKSNKLKEIIVDDKPLDKVWNPTAHFNHVFKRNRLHKYSVPSSSNLLMVKEWLSVDELTDWSKVVTLYREKSKEFPHPHTFLLDHDE